MKNKFALIAPALAAGAAAAAIIAAPIASASTISQDCDSTGGGTVCQSPGNVQIDATPGPASFEPYGDEGFLLGDGFVGGGFGGGGFHGGGFGGGGFHGGGHR